MAEPGTYPFYRGICFRDKKGFQLMLMDQKASPFVHYKEPYQIINQETAKAIAGDGYNFINREEDMGIEGLRQAKHSYAPCDLVPSYTLTTA